MCVLTDRYLLFFPRNLHFHGKGPWQSLDAKHLWPAESGSSGYQGQRFAVSICWAPPTHVNKFPFPVMPYHVWTFGSLVDYINYITISWIFSTCFLLIAFFAWIYARSDFLCSLELENTHVCVDGQVFTFFPRNLHFHGKGRSEFSGEKPVNIRNLVTHEGVHRGK